MNPTPEAVLAWRPLAEKYAAVNPPLLANEILSIMQSESRGDPNAVNPEPPEPARDRGLLQLEMPEAQFYGNITDPQELFDPETNIAVGARFLADLKRKYAAKYPNGVWTAAYNAGEKRFLEGFHDPDYVNAFLSHLESLNAGG